MMRLPALLPLAVTMGEPAGIGPETILSAWLARKQRALPPFAAYGDPRVFVRIAAALSRPVSVVTIGNVGEATPCSEHALPVVDTGSAYDAAPGHPDPRAAAAVIAAIDRATADTVSGAAAGIVTAPISKAALYASGFAHPGHTEYLAHLARAYVPGFEDEPVMMLASAELRVVPLTVHIPLASVPAAISRALIERTAVTVHEALRRDFGIGVPRIAIAGLNPHAGEEGTIGTEDRDLIVPAITALRARGLDVTGPLPADTMFHARARERYDAAIAMYHDQALIPIKTLAFDTGVNVTLGLPFVRTSPDHGTAFDIAGRGIASPESLIAAIELAAEMASRRASATVST